MDCGSAVGSARSDGRRGHDSRRGQHGEVVRFAQMFGDGEFQAYLASFVVDRLARRHGVARTLVCEALRHVGGERVDLLSEDAAVGFYESFSHRRKPGFRVDPLMR